MGSLIKYYIADVLNSRDVTYETLGIVAPYLETVEQVKMLVGCTKLRPLKGEKLKLILDNLKPIKPEGTNTHNAYKSRTYAVHCTTLSPPYSSYDPLPPPVFCL